jgi:transposase-like protein
MKGKKYSTAEKIRILRQADGARSILEVCREAELTPVN